MDIIKEMLKKDITRPINGVVKAETNSNDVELTEISEYVVTREVRGHMSKLFTRYSDSLNTPTDDIGIWISGFFGSGKSHLLKMLGHIFENKNYLDNNSEKKSTTDFFREKLNDDEILMGNIERSSRVDTDVILFNIDNVSDQNSHQNKDTIALSFLKKLNEYQGFFRDDIKVSELERDLWKKDRFEEFKNLYKDISGKDWEDARRTLDFNADFFLEVIGDMNLEGFSEDSAERWLDKDIVPSVSAEYLRDIIKDYLDKKGNEHRIIFLVDEIGQYIGDNSQLMLNLQTVTEVLGTAFQGRVWIGVTSQQDMTSLLQDNNNKKNDFSKIQGRFKNILPLSSGNIDEVIKKRLLEKKEIVKEDLENYYEKHRVEIDNLISFDKQGLNLETYIDKHDFAETYPFVGYQFNLLQKVFEKVRTMGHSGKHLSQGERSLLSAFQEAGIKMNEKETGALVPFYYFFDSIRQFLEDNAYRPFLHAEQNRALNQEEDIKVLQLLFLLKDMEGIAPNIDNLASFMIESVDTDIVELKKNLKKSLGRLEQQVLISRDGDFYYFLTNEEQEINKEIKDEQVIEEEVYKKLNEIIFENIFQTTSVLVPETGYKYVFNKYIDGNGYGKADGQINLSVFTSWFDDYDNVLMVGNREEYELIIQLPRVDDYLKEIRVILQTQKLISNKSTQVNRTRIQDILTRVQRENRNRSNRVKEEIENYILNSSVYIKGIKKDISGKNAKTFLEESIRFLAMEKFKDAGLIKRKYDESYIKDILLSEYEAQQKLEITLDKESNPNKEAIFEINNKIKQLTDRSLQVTLKSLLDNYSIAPYGWDALAVNGVVAELVVLGSIDIIESGEQIEDRRELQKLLTRTQTKNLERVVIKPKEDIDPQLLTRVNNKLKSVFGLASDEVRKNPKEDLFKVIENQKNLANMNLREIKANSYPGEKITKEWIDLLDEILQIRGKTTAVLKEFLNLAEDLEDIEPKYYAVKDFFDTKKKDKFDLMNQKLKKYDTYKDYFITIHKENSYKELLSIREDSNPYGKIKDIDGLLDDLSQKEKETIIEEIENLKEKAKNKINELSKEFKANETLNKSLNDKMTNFITNISNLESIEVFHKERELNNICDSLIRDYKESIKSEITSKEREIIEKLKNKDDITELENRVIKAYSKLRNDVDNEENIINIKDYLVIAESEKTQFVNEAEGKSQKRQRVQVRRLQAKAKINVETEEDVNSYIASLEDEISKLKNEMLSAVKENKIVDVK
jgi:hypothetical protein